MTHRVEPALATDEAALCALWNACRSDTHPLSSRAMRQNLDGAARTGRVTSLVVRDGGRPVGWALARAHFAKGMAPAEAAMLEGTGNGGLAALCVEPAARGQGIGSALLAAAERQLQDWGVAAAGSTLAPFHFLPGVPSEAPDLDRLLDRNGWALVNETMDLEGDVTEYQPLTEPAGVDHRPLRAGEEPNLLHFMKTEFPGVWQFILTNHLAAGGALDDIIVAVEDGQILGFCQIHAPRSVLPAGSTLFAPTQGGLGPIGIGGAHRKRGLGLALLDAALTQQKRRGVGRMMIDWTTLAAFYGKVGFRPVRRYLQRRKTF